MKKTKGGSNEGKGGDSPSQRIDPRIKELSDWRGETLARFRMLIKQAAPVGSQAFKAGSPAAR
jgi:hypothetical protein